MDRIPFTFTRGGRSQMVTPTQAKVLARARLGTYETRDMARAPASAAVAPAVAASAPRDYLDDMAEVPLRALALERGLELHHRLGLDKVRAAIRAQPPVAPPTPAPAPAPAPELAVPQFVIGPNTTGPTE